MSGYPEDRWAMPGTEMSTENVSHDANPAHQKKATPVISHFNSSAMPIDTHFMASIDSPYVPPSSTTNTQDILASSSSSSSGLSWADSIPFNGPAFYGDPNVAEPGLSYPMSMSQKSWDDWHSSVSQPSGPGFHGEFVTPPGLGVNTSLTEAMVARLGQAHSGDIPWDHGFTQHTAPQRQICERPAAQRVWQGGSDRILTCPVENCDKSFSGGWELTRHVTAIHRPPTIGCRECNYKQSRKDLFSEHCRKRHPGRSVDDMMIQLVMPSE